MPDPWREDQRFGQVAAAVWNASGGIPVEGSKQGRPATPQDFFARLPKPPDLEGSDGGGDDAEDDVDGAVEPDDADFEVVASEDEVAQQTEYLKNVFYLWGTAVNKAQKDRQDGGPGKPDAG